VLIYFIHHIAVTIQLPRVIASISRELTRTIEVQFPHHRDPSAELPADGQANANGSGQAHRPQLDQADHPDAQDMLARLEHLGVVVPATTSGYLQFVRYEDLVQIATDTDTVLQLHYRAGHFITAGLPLARVWPATNAPKVVGALQRAHVAGPTRTLTQDPVFAIDQLVEIAIRALSPAVNDPFTALTCIDWLTDALCRVSERELPGGVRRDETGRIRLIETTPGSSTGHRTRSARSAGTCLR
jgi:uncharacterized membrane protein